jgi:hypothetical protein
MSSPTRQYAVVTPYFQEPREMLEHCIDSVRRQSLATTHLLVADGHPQPWIDALPVRHLKLDRSHRDNGNTPRGLGCLLAAAERYDGIGLLDADNWLDRGHVEACVGAARAMPGGICDYVIARRRFFRMDGTEMPWPDEPLREHVDTSCFFFLPGAFHMLPTWALMPSAAGPVCDRIFYQAIRQRPLVAAVTRQPTVNFLCRYASVYQALGEAVPSDAKPNPDNAAFLAYLRRLSDRELEIESRRLGAPLRR